MIATDPAAETYRDVQKMIWQLCWRFCRRGGDFDEHLSIANEAFVKAYKTHDPDKAEFTTHCYLQVYFALQKFRATYSKRRERMHEVPLPDSAKLKESRLWDSVWGQVGDDARTVMVLISESPAELLGIALQEIVSLRVVLFRRLRAMGWSIGRAGTAFDELSDVLTEGVS